MKRNLFLTSALFSVAAPILYFIQMMTFRLEDNYSDPLGIDGVITFFTIFLLAVVLITFKLTLDKFKRPKPTPFHFGKIAGIVLLFGIVYLYYRSYIQGATAFEYGYKEAYEMLGGISGIIGTTLYIVLVTWMSMDSARNFK